MATLDITNITPPRVPLTDARTGLISREWYRFFLNLFMLTGGGTNQVSLTDLQVGPPIPQQEDLTDINIEIEGVQKQPAPGTSELQAALDNVRQQLQTLPRQELGTMSALQQAWFPWMTFDNAPEITPPDVGTVAWDGGTTLGVQMTANVLGRVNESGYYYIKASGAITKGQVIMFTGAVGASGVPTGAPATGVTDGSYIMGIAAESIALNGFGLVQFQGTLRGVNLSTYADGDILWYNPAVTGGLTKTKPSAPNVKIQMAAVISATNNGTMLIRVTAGSELGGTDSNVLFGTLNNGDLIQYDSVNKYWKNVPSSTFGTGSVTSVGLSLPSQFAISGSPVTTTGTLTAAWNTQTANYVLAGPTTGAAAAPTFRALVSGDIPSLSYVSSVGATAPITSTGGLTPTIGVTSSALTKTDDTNVTLTLGGSPTTALLAATSLTLGWTGQLAVNRGGTGLSSGTSGGIPYFSSSSAIASSAALTQYGVVYGGGAGAAPTATAAGTTGQVLTANTGGAPSWASPAYTGTVTSVSVVSANGFAGSVATATTTPAITISTSISGLLYGNGTALAAATVSAPLSYSAGTLSIPVATSSANGYLSSTDWSTFNSKQSVAAPVTYTSNFSVGATDVWIINNKSGSSCTATLPTASSYTGRVLYFQNYQAQTLISASSNVVPMAGGAAGTAILAAVAGDTCTLVSDGTNWIMMQYTPNNVLLLE